MNAKLSARFREAKKWKAEGLELRKVLLDCGLVEELKWGKPCYSHDGNNIAIIQRMNDFLALMFFKGALLKDKKGLLQRQGENSNAARRLQFTSVGEVKKLTATIKTCVREAIAAEKAGLKVPKAPKKDDVAELAERLAKEPALKKAFQALTPGRQREYNLHFGSAKQSKTRIARIEKCAPKILAGKGFRE